MINWQVTATTIYCDAVDDEVTLMIYKDGTKKCTGYVKYGEPSKETTSMVKSKSKQLNRKLECEGLECPQITQYRDKLFSEEAIEPSGKETAEQH